MAEIHRKIKITNEEGEILARRSKVPCPLNTLPGLPIELQQQIYHELLHSPAGYVTLVAQTTQLNKPRNSRLRIQSHDLEKISHAYPEMKGFIWLFGEPAVKSTTRQKTSGNTVLYPSRISCGRIAASGYEEAYHNMRGDDMALAQIFGKQIAHNGPLAHLERKLIFNIPLTSFTLETNGIWHQEAGWHLNLWLFIFHPYWEAHVLISAGSLEKMQMSCGHLLHIAPFHVAFRPVENSAARREYHDHLHLFLNISAWKLACLAKDRKCSELVIGPALQN
ncbi:uncharacterized protein PAC_00062 [Phialocephala subalpina]|uniref:Uncharacterized protein n=1 Tax=Phialocephala subalpina TaxID=576137 RepID=A0A1L7WBP3_9HELO|nr:uncharacterized protein PAC_00062 [Phialocephala subalpina]